MPLSEPRGELIIRYEPDSKSLYVPAAVFKKYCVERQVNYKDTLRSLAADGVYLEPVNKRMSTGMKISSPPVRALKFNAKDFGIEQIVTQNAS